MDKVECAGRILARALGYGTAWEARYSYDDDDWRPAGEGESEAVTLGGEYEEDAGSTISDGLPVCRESETLERAGDSVSAWLGKRNVPARYLTPAQRRERSKLTPEQCEELWAWEAAHPLTRGQKKNPFRPREFDHWKRTGGGAGIQVVRPQHRMNPDTLRALVGLPKPLEAILILYAVGDAKQWPVVQRFARACLPSVTDTDMAEGMYRLLADPPMAKRAKELGLRRDDWNARSLPSLRLFENWIERAAATFLDTLERSVPQGCSQGEGLRAETWWHPEK